MKPEVHIRATRRDQPLHDGAIRHATPVEALEHIKLLQPARGARWTARSCGVCGGYHVVKEAQRA